jgi:hypothetical protein
MHDAREQADPELCCWSADEIEGARQRSVDHGSKWRRSGGRCYVLSISQCSGSSILFFFPPPHRLVPIVAFVAPLPP